MQLKKKIKNPLSLINFDFFFEMLYFDYNFHTLVTFILLKSDCSLFVYRYLYKRQIVLMSYNV